jgi:hypothetical protein
MRSDAPAFVKREQPVGQATPAPAAEKGVDQDLVKKICSVT